MDISVALCTYNGAAYLGAQLHSISAQSLLPTELVISDDGSTDATAAIIDDFSHRVPFSVRFIRQPKNLGVVQNFGAALAQCRGELIVLCDQDDVWLPDKLRASAEFLQTHPDCWSVFTDAIVTDEKLHPYTEAPRLWQHVHLTDDLRKRIANPTTSLPALINHECVTGATVMLRRELLQYLLPIPDTLPGWMIHDGWLAVVAAALGRLDSLDQPTILYRQHAAQQMGLKPDVAKPGFFQTPRRRCERVAKRSEYLHAALMLRVGEQAVPEAIAEVHSHATHFRLRADLPASPLRRIRPILSEWKRAGYRRFCRYPLFSAVRDAVL